MTDQSELKLFDDGEPQPKYIVFKYEDFRDWFNTSGDGELMPSPLADAVVIRRQDTFAAAALYTYAHSIAIAARLCRDMGLMEKGQRLQAIADYFASEAALAVEADVKYPD